MKSIIAKFLLPVLAAVGLAVPAFATSGGNAGIVSNTFVFATSGSRDFQFTIQGLGTLCPGHNYVYADVADPNYATIVANVTTARQFGSTIRVFWTTDAGGFCHITQIWY